MKNDRKYFKVIAKCGHVGKRHYIPIAYAVVAKSAHEASQAVMKYRRVKKHMKSAIISCAEISKEDYNTLKEENDNNPYLHCKVNKDEFAIADLEDKVISFEKYRYSEDKYIEKMENKAFKIKKTKLIENW